MSFATSNFHRVDSIIKGQLNQPFDLPKICFLNKAAVSKTESPQVVSTEPIQFRQSFEWIHGDGKPESQY